MSELDPNRTPPTVIGAVAAGTVVVPFLIVYAFLFIVHGAFVQPDQPDITGSRSGELVAGLVALAFLLLVLWGMGRLLNGYDRWVFVLGQLITAGAALDLLLDSASGEPQVPAVVLAAALLALVLTFLPPSWLWVASRGGQQVLFGQAGRHDRAEPSEPSAGRPG
ncbi:hypothetical protein [Jatrophihabitans sp.]|uniref:hypothetical protein n=1 Tax=Jatrophihabitans sp. TaxID=1932789 RepID=UPI002D15E62D|nr:hypothetical protein [Jatrophihabitans sp.]